jgi:hypothetical protein
LLFPQENHTFGHHFLSDISDIMLVMLQSVEVPSLALAWDSVGIQALNSISIPQYKSSKDP